MKEIIEKLSSYHILNYLLPGTVFVIFANKFTNYNFFVDNTILAFFLFYFIGLAISRVGSLILDPIYKKTGLIIMLPYDDYLSAQKKDPQLDVLSEANNMFRSLSSTFFLLLLLKLWQNLELRVDFLRVNHYWVLIITLLLLFMFSYQKQTNYITSRIKKAK